MFVFVLFLFRFNDCVCLYGLLLFIWLCFWYTGEISSSIHLHRVRMLTQWFWNLKRIYWTKGDIRFCSKKKWQICRVTKIHLHLFLHKFFSSKTTTKLSYYVQIVNKVNNNNRIISHVLLWLIDIFIEVACVE